MKKFTSHIKRWCICWALIVVSLIEEGISKTTYKSLPSVDESNSGNVTSQLGKTASLRCRIDHKDNFTVSWIRHRDLHLLTVDHYTYTTDQRFKSLHESHTGDWVLLISSVQPRDKGFYECQIGTTPPNGHFVFLDVREPITKIFGGNDLHINLGSPLNLTCLVLYHAKPPDVEWYHEGKVVGYKSTRGGISVVTESGELTKSSLLISHAKTNDSGNYTCVPIEGEKISIDVHVLSGENRAAMHSNADRREEAFYSWRLLTLCIWVELWRGSLLEIYTFFFTTTNKAKY